MVRGTCVWTPELGRNVRTFFLQPYFNSKVRNRETHSHFSYSHQYSTRLEGIRLSKDTHLNLANGIATTAMVSNSNYLCHNSVSLYYVDAGGSMPQQNKTICVPQKIVTS